MKNMTILQRLNAALLLLILLLVAGVGLALWVERTGSSAIQRTDGTTFVLLEKGKGEYERRTVKTGAEFDGMTEILDGLTPQDRVVSTGGVLLKRDAR